METYYPGMMDNDYRAKPAANTECGRVNVGDIERASSVVAGGALALCGIRKLDSLGGLLMTAIGGSLLYRGVSGHCQMYDVLGMNTAARNRATSVPAQQGTKVERSIRINRSPAEIYAFWRNFDNLPKFMSHLVSVECTGSNRSHWVARGPLGTSVAWDAEIINERPGEMIAWRSVAGSEIDMAGSVHFSPAPGGQGTEVRVSLKYNPPGGKIGIGVAKLFGKEPQRQIQVDLERLKQVCEAGELATTSGQTSGRATQAEVTSAAQPSHKASEVDTASIDSFPASDPPAFTATSASNTKSSFDRYQ